MGTHSTVGLTMAGIALGVLLYGNFSVSTDRTPPLVVGVATTGAPMLVVNAHNAGDHLAVAACAVAAHAGMVEIDVARIGAQLFASHDVLSSGDPAVAKLPKLLQSWSIARAAGRVLFDLKSSSNTAVDQLMGFLRAHQGPALWFSTSNAVALERVGRAEPHSMRLLTVRDSLALAHLLATSINPPLINGVSIEQHLLTRRVVLALRRRGLWIQAYTVDQMPSIRTLSSWGVAGITTNDLRLVEALAGSSQVGAGTTHAIPKAPTSGGSARKAKSVSGIRKRGTSDSFPPQQSGSCSE